MLAISLSSAFFFVDSLIVMMAASLLVPLLSGVAKVPYGWLFRSLRPIFLIIVLTFAVHIIFTPGMPLAAIGPFAVSGAGIRNGLFYSLRICLVILLFSFVTLTTTPVELTDAIESIFGPLKKIRLPIHEIALMTTIAIRFIPTFISETEVIAKAQKGRGADFESGNIFRRIKSLMPLIIPLFISAFRRADELALAMEARCYIGGEGRTRLHELRIENKDIVWLMGGLAVIFLIAGSRWVI
jgi:energy-coupling factor transport system permease protein